MKTLTALLLTVLLSLSAVVGVCFGQLIDNTFPNGQNVKPVDWGLFNYYGQLEAISFPFGIGFYWPHKQIKDCGKDLLGDGLEVCTYSGVSQVVMQVHALPLCVDGCTYVGTFVKANATGHLIPSEIGVSKRGRDVGDGSLVDVLEGDTLGTFTIRGQSSSLQAHLQEETWPRTEYGVAVPNTGSLTAIVSYNNQPIQQLAQQALAEVGAYWIAYETDVMDGPGAAVSFRFERLLPFFDLSPGIASPPGPAAVPIPVKMTTTLETVCAKLPPICAGGLLSQHATVDQINAYIKKYLAACMGTSPPTCNCRFMRPTRCYIGEKRVCPDQCTP